MSRKLIVALAAALFATAAYAACRTYSVTMPDGRIMWCTECCYAGICNVTCN